MGKRSLALTLRNNFCSYFTLCQLNMAHSIVREQLLRAGSISTMWILEMELRVIRLGGDPSSIVFFGDNKYYALILLRKWQVNHQRK